MERIKMLIDTDMGGDIDDAIAIAMALNTPEIDVLGVTTLYFSNQWRKENIQKMMRAYDRPEIPVCRGAECPLLGTWSEDYPRDRCLPNEAVPFIIDTCRANPGLTLLAIAPLTNVALALQIAPDIAKTTRIFVMGGMITCAHPEWNIQCDPEAARIVLESGAEITLVGLDVTEKCKLQHAEIRELMAADTQKMAFMRGELERFYQMFDFLPTLHDPLTLAAVLWPELFTFEMKDICVETVPGCARGVTLDRRFSAHPHVRCATGVDAAEAVRRMCRRMTGEA